MNVFQTVENIIGKYTNSVQKLRLIFDKHANNLTGNDNKSRRKCFVLSGCFVCLKIKYKTHI